MHALFRSSFSIQPCSPTRPVYLYVALSSSPLTRGYLTLIQPWNVRTTRHVIYPPIVNFPNIITSLGIIRIPSGLVIVERRLSVVDHRALLSMLLFFGVYDAAGYARYILPAIVSHVIDLSHRVDIPRLYLSRRGEERGSIRSYNSLFGISGQGGT